MQLVRTKALKERLDFRPRNKDRTQAAMNQKRLRSRVVIHSDGEKRDRSINLRAMHFQCYILSICCVVVPAKFMRFPRVKADGQAFYHCVSRVVEGRFIFQVSGHGSVEAERFIMLMRRLA
jgi:hypothetical protein